MSKYFLGSVGSAEAFRNTDAGRQLAFVCKTLTDSSINISTTKDDLRGGTGAPIVTNFYHDPNVEITLTDIFWKESYLEAQLGAMFQAGADIAAYQSETLTASSGVVTLSKGALPLNVACDTEDKATVWFAKSGSEEWHTAQITSGNNSVTVGGSSDTGEYCVRYLANDEQARDAIVTSNIIPEELYLIITTPIFFGDSCSTSNGKLAGSLTFEIPRFKLNGAQNFSFNMSSNTTMELSGTALADFTGCDMINGRLVRIIESIEGRTVNDGLIAIAIDGGNGYTANTAMKVYAIYEGGSKSPLKWAQATTATSANYINGGATATYTASNGTVSFSATGSVTLSYYPAGTSGANFSCAITVA